MATAEQALPLNFEAFNRLGATRKIGTMVAIAAAIALLVGGWLWAREPPYGVLFSNLSEQDGGQIVAALEQQNIPHRISENGNAILVPVGRVHDVRLRLASQGLPKGGLVGFEVMETQKLGISQFAEQINYQRALEGELARSIQSMAAVVSARVHLAIPKQTAFLRDEQKPTASVLVNLRPGRTLDRGQIAGVVHLISSSVPQLNPAQVSVIDQDGILLTRQDGAAGDASLNPNQIKYVREIEQSYIKRIEAILIPVVGASNVRAQVALDIDFSRIDQIAEIFRPNPSPETAIRSQQTSESGMNQPGAGGVPGALTNQPPVPATAPITTPAVPSAGGPSQPNYSRNATINYEVDKTIRHTKSEPGSIRRVSVAVVINQKQVEDKKTGKSQPVPRTEAELKKVTALVQEAMGFSKERGDTVNVADVSFAPEEREVLPDTPIWKDPAAILLAREAGSWLLYGLLALLLWIKILKPTIALFVPPPPREEPSLALEKEEAEVLAAAAEAEQPAEPESSVFEDKLRRMHELVKQDPRLVANIIKEWMSGAES